MAIGATTVSMSTLRTEFGVVTDPTAANPISMSQLYRKTFSNNASSGCYVPDGVPQNATVPTSGQISFSNLRSTLWAYVHTQTITNNTDTFVVKNSNTDWSANYPTKPLAANITINSGVYVYVSTSSYAFDTGTALPTNSTCQLYNYGAIVGRGGIGGQGQNRLNDGTLTCEGTAGVAYAMRINPTMKTYLYNYGIIGGGGGGAAGGYGDGGSAGGGGGGGRALASGGSSGISHGSVAGYGYNGTLDAPGLSWTSSVAGGSYAPGYSGGDLGQSGGNAATPTAYNGYGGAAGGALNGNAYTVYAVTGTIYGAIV